MLLKVGELAKHTGLTVRTLHHYDEIGLLKPSGRSESGYRLYSRSDVARLHGIQALRHLGLPLADIAAMLDGRGTAPALIIEQQIRSLDREIAQAADLRGHLELLQHQLAKGDEPDMTAWLDALALMKTYGKYFSAAELKTIFANWNLIEGEWAPLVAAVRDLMDRGVAADSAQAQPLARRWMSLMLHWMGGDFDLIDRWGEMYRREPSAHGRNGAPQSDMIDFIRRAIDARMALLTKYLSAEEVRRFRHVPDSEWLAINEQAEALIAGQVPPDSEPARALARRWLDVLDRMVNQDAAVRERLLRAHAGEPLLRAGTVLSAQARAYLAQSAPGA
jgi:DNA-binding transcriptional MerR regulator